MNILARRTLRAVQNSNVFNISYETEKRNLLQ